MWAKHKQSGFTIVELLIVIVVIGILAAITIVAYNGIQTRAENTKTLNGVAAYAKAFALYAVDNGKYPSTPVYPCLGSPADNNCGRVVQGSTSCGYSGITSVTSAFDTLITPYLGSSKPSISDQTMTCGTGDIYKGAYVNGNVGDPRTLSMIVYLKGDVACTAAAAATVSARQQSGGTTVCTLNMPTLP